MEISRSRKLRRLYEDLTGFIGIRARPERIESTNISILVGLSSFDETYVIRSTESFRSEPEMSWNSTRKTNTRIHYFAYINSILNEPEACAAWPKGKSFRIWCETEMMSNE